MPEIILTTREELEDIVKGAVRFALAQQKTKVQDKDEEACVLTRQQVADKLKVSLSTVDGLAREGVLTKIKIGRSVRFDNAQVERLNRVNL